MRCETNLRSASSAWVAAVAAPSALIKSAAKPILPSGLISSVVVSCSSTSAVSGSVAGYTVPGAAPSCTTNASPRPCKPEIVSSALER